MFLKYFLIVSVSFSVLCTGFSIRKADSEIEVDKDLKADYGEAIASFLRGFLDSFPAEMPLAWIGGYNLTSLSEVVKLEERLRMSGAINIKKITVFGLPTAEIPVSLFVINGIFNPIPLNVEVTNPSLKLRVEFDIDGESTNFQVPIKGQGVYDISLNLNFGIEATMKCQIGSPVIVLMTDFSYHIRDLENLQVKVEGQFENAGGWFGVEAFLEDFTQQTVFNLEKVTNELFRPVVPNYFNGLRMTLEDILEILQP